MSDVTDSRDTMSDLDQVFLEYLRRLDAHGKVDHADLLRSQPGVSSAFQELLNTAEQIKRMAGPRRDSESNPTTDWSSGNVAFEDTVHSPVDGRPTTALLAGASLIGAQLGDYQILEELGRGGMGVVYKARQIGMGREVALKMIRDGCLASEGDVQRFYFEAKAAGRLNHQLILDVYQVGEIGGNHFFSMEYVPGDNLAEYARRKQLSWREIAEVLLQVAEAIDYAHQQGLLHRDLKPSNVLVDSQGRPRITDFGLAKDLHAGEGLTTSGSVLGTPSYMSPEQAEARREEISRRSDVYSLGAILYTLLTGRPPFRAASTIDTLMQVIHEMPVPPRSLNAECPRGLEAICLKCLQKSPSSRYATAHELADDLGRFLHGERVLARPHRAHHRAWQWLSNVPIVAGALGRKATRPTVWHVRSQWIVLAAAVAVIIGAVAWPRMIEIRRLATVDLSTGPEFGRYINFGDALATRLRESTGRNVQLHNSFGSVESHDRLVSGRVDLAFLQENALEAHGLKVLAPLYREVTLVLVRKDSTFRSVLDLAGHRVALGPPGSGMRLSSRKLLEFYGLRETELRDIDRWYVDLDEHPELEAAIVTIKVDAPALQDLLQSGEYRFLPLERVNDIPGFRTMLLREQDVPPGLVPPENLLVPATFAILAVREETPDVLVTEVLDALYSDGGVSEAFDQVFSLDAAAAWMDLSYHDAAERYFREARSQP